MRPRGRALGVDYGQRRIGLALSDATGLLARAWKTVARTGNPSQVATALAQEVDALAREDDGLSVVVVGLPRRLSGEATELTDTVFALVDRLRLAYPPEYSSRCCARCSCANGRRAPRASATVSASA